MKTGRVAQRAFSELIVYGRGPFYQRERLREAIVMVGQPLPFHCGPDAFYPQLVSDVTGHWTT